ncbi:hypothetical protein QR680_015743 [Steinernema hermaphroditum]|uniref:Uncharacterized protein n=1 Tax=Steinernema hermaphroditum TaxID=289476 RepID=A0AA39HAP7_9BILA|nr:hypothetical protein QR680_015743 [Steinernema hermaphroditum]
MIFLLTTMYIAVVVLLAVSAAQAQDIYSLADYAHTYGSTVPTTDDIVKVANALVNQMCGGATLQQIADNLQQTVMNNIGGQTAFTGMAVGQRLQNDLGNDATPVKNAVASVGMNLATPVYNDLVQYCSSGADAVFARANAYANHDYLQQAADQVVQAINSVSANDWTICRNDLANYVFFQYYGY